MIEKKQFVTLFKFNNIDEPENVFIIYFRVVKSDEIVR